MSHFHHKRHENLGDAGVRTRDSISTSDPNKEVEIESLTKLARLNTICFSSKTYLFCCFFLVCHRATIGKWIAKA